MQKSHMASLKDVSSLNPDNVSATRKRLNICCKLSYHPRRVKDKGALLVLVWNFLIMSVLYLLNNYFGYRYTWGIAIFGVTLLIAGWLADTHIGRYKVVRTSIWIMWITSVIATVSSIVAHLIENYGGIHSNLLAVAFFVMAMHWSWGIPS